jgi:hypothetical protein
MNSELGGFLYSLALSLPFFLIYFIGIALSIVFRQRLGKVWMLPILAFVLHTLASLVYLSGQAIFYFYIIPTHNYSPYESLSTIFGIVTTFLQIIGDVLILIALFARRGNEVKV